MDNYALIHLTSTRLLRCSLHPCTRKASRKIRLRIAISIPEICAFAHADSSGRIISISLRLYHWPRSIFIAWHHSLHIERSCNFVLHGSIWHTLLLGYETAWNTTPRQTAAKDIFIISTN